VTTLSGTVKNLERGQAEQKQTMQENTKRLNAVDTRTAKIERDVAETKAGIVDLHAMANKQIDEMQANRDEILARQTLLQQQEQKLAEFMEKRSAEQDKNIANIQADVDEMSSG